MTLSPVEQSDIILANRPVAYGIVKREFGHLDGDLRDELRSEALLGLVEAAKNYDPEFRGLDGTVATFATYAYPWVRGRCLSYLIRQQRHWGQEPVYEDDVGGDDNTDDNATSARADARRLIEPYLSALAPRDREMVRLTYGLVDGRMWTHREIGELYKIDGTRARQIVNRAMRRMRTGVSDPVPDVPDGENQDTLF